MAARLCAWFTCRWFSVIQVLVGMYIPLATNTLTDFHMATNSRLIVTQIVHYIDEISAKRLQRQNLQNQEKPANYGMSGHFE